MYARFVRFKLILFVTSCFLTLFFGCEIYLQQIPNILSQKIEKVRPQLEELEVLLGKAIIRAQNDIPKNYEQNFSNTEPNRQNIKLLNPKDIIPFDGDILILVTSNIGFSERRGTIRSTWGNSSRFVAQRRMFNSVTYKVYFNTGYLQSAIEKAKVESLTFKDLLITNRTENYWDLSRRVMLGFLWSLENCKYDYLLKADDDVFVNIPNFLKMIYTDPFVLAHKDRIFAGRIWPETPTIREPFSKWYVPEYEWPRDFYPPFATGMGILLSRLILENMRPHFNWVKPFRLDDVYVGMLVEKANVSRIGIRIPKIEDEFLGYNPSSKCKFLKLSIVFHKVSKAWCMERLTVLSIRYSYFESYRKTFFLVFLILIFLLAYCVKKRYF